MHLRRRSRVMTVSVGALEMHDDPALGRARLDELGHHLAAGRRQVHAAGVAVKQGRVECGLQI